ncbi:MAG: DUF4360 domain-containing protein [Candidatus Electrothrix sp. AX5]|nr:DUF4360 domain-containing protein [Candidatus Electrothrix sp. AX5]
MKMVKTVLTVVAVAACTFIASQAFADTVYFKAPMKFNGTGCKNASSVDYTGDGTDTLSIMFGGFDAANPSSEAVSKLKRSACNFAVPVHVPQGFQVSLMTSDWRGYSDGGKNALKRKYFFAGKLTGAAKTSYPKGDFTIRDKLQHATLTWAKCGQDVTLRVNASLMADRRKKDSYIAVDTLDLKNYVKFKLSWKKCQ